MRQMVRSFKAYPVMTLTHTVGTAVLWGVMEFVALRRSHALARASQKD